MKEATNRFRQVIEINIIPAEVALTGELLGHSDILNLHSQLNCGARGERGHRESRMGTGKVVSVLHIIRGGCCM
jgi:hypothetical protein